MQNFILRLFLQVIFILFTWLQILSAEIVNDIKVSGNKRISSDTIKIFSLIKINDDINDTIINNALKSLYKTNFFENIEINFNNNILLINVVENPIIQDLNIEGVKAQRIKNELFDKISLKSRSSFFENILEKDLEIIRNTLKDQGYYFSKVDASKEILNDNKINLTINVDIGKKAKIKKISFLGNKIFKDSKLKNVIISEEYKFWKFISGKKYLNENLNNLDLRLLKNFYLNNGFYNAEINSSIAKNISDDEFELIFNINANNKYFFNELKLDLPIEFDKNNFSKLIKFFDDIKDKPYSIDDIQIILDQIDQITITEQYESIKANVLEDISENKINLTFKIEESEKLTVEKINITGNNITNENVIRNQLILDEGDPFNEILATKSINNIKSLNFFKNVKSDIVEGTNSKSKIINITVEEKPTGEITAGAGFGTDGGTVVFGVKENNFLGRGIGVNANMTVNKDSLKGLFSITNNNFNNSDKAVYVSAEATEIDKFKNSGYKMNKIGFNLGTNFEYLDDFSLGLSTSSFIEKIETNSTASARQKAQAGNYFDTFTSINFDYDKRNQKFQTSDGFRTFYDVRLPIVSDSNTLTNTFSHTQYTELYENNISSISYFFKSVNSLTNKDVKLSERAFISSNKLRGFESGKVGPKDGKDYVGGNFVSSVNLSTTLPFLLENSQNTDFLMFFDAANIWGVDYDSSISDNSTIRSSVGIGVDWYTVVGPMSLSLSQVLSKADTDITESFRFNLGTTF